MTCPAASTVACSLSAIADRLAKLAPSHRDPERYHIDKSELVHDLHQLAQRLEDKHPVPERKLETTP